MAETHITQKQPFQYVQTSFFQTRVEPQPLMKYSQLKEIRKKRGRQKEGINKTAKEEETTPICSIYCLLKPFTDHHPTKSQTGTHNGLKGSKGRNHLPYVM